MSIQELSIKLKAFCTNSETLLVLIIVATAGVSFYLGRTSVQSVAEKPVSFHNQSAQAVSATDTSPVEATTSPKVSENPPSKQALSAEEVVYVASKNGTKYHLPWCAGAKQIKEENKITFASKEEAQKAGYTPASNCKGI